MSSLARFRLITFDVTNTLLQFRSSPSQRYGEIGALFGVVADDSNLAKTFKSNWHRMNKNYPNFGRTSNMNWQTWWRELIASTFADTGTKIPEAKLDNFTNHLLELYKESISWEHCNGSVDLLDYLHKLQRERNSSNPLVLGLIANFDPRLDTLLKNMRMEHYFQFALNSYDAEVTKPAKAIFEKAINAARLPALKPNECLHIGDGPTTDYIGALEAGWHAALVHEKSAHYLIDKYGKRIQERFVFASLFDFHKKVLHDSIKW